MRAPCLLRLDDAGLDAWRADRSGATCIASFAADGVGAFGAWLRQQPPARRYRLMLELGDEAFEVEDLPQVRGRDRHALLARRLAAHFPDPAFAAVVPLGSAGAPAGHERVLFTGLTRPALLGPWMDALRAAGARLELLVSAPRLLAHFAPRALGLGTDVVVASFTRAGMRLSHLAQGRLHFSRLLAHCSAEATVADRLWLDELERTRRYAASLGDSGVLPAAVVLAEAGALGALPDDSLPAPMPATELRFLAPASLGLPMPAGTADLAPLLLHWLARAPRRLGWAGAPPPRPARSRRAGVALLGGGALVLVAASLSAAWQWNELAALGREREQLEQRQRTVRRTLTELESVRPAQPLAPQAIVDTIARLEQALPPRLAPEALFARIASALAQPAPGELRQLRWNTRAAGEAAAAVEVTLGFAVDGAAAATQAARLEAIAAALERGGAREVRRLPGEAGGSGLTLLLLAPPDAAADAAVGASR